MPYLGLALGRLPKCETRKLKDELVLVLANAMHYNAGLTLQVRVCVCVCVGLCTCFDASAGHEPRP